MTYGAACSLDGFIAGPHGEIDWLHFSTDVQELMTKYWAGVDTVLMGRKTWDVAMAAAPAGNSMPGVETTFVFSRTLDTITQPGVRLVRDNAAEFVRHLKQQAGQGICLMGGGELATVLLEAGLVDEVGLNVHPILLGAGIPMFRTLSGRIRLELTETRALDGGCVLMSYRVARP